MFSQAQKEPFRDRSPFSDRLSGGQLPNEGQGLSEGVVQFLDLCVRVAAYLAFEDVQGVPQKVRRVQE